MLLKDLPKKSPDQTYSQTQVYVFCHVIFAFQISKIKGIRTIPRNR